MPAIASWWREFFPFLKLVSTKRSESSPNRRNSATLPLTSHVEILEDRLMLFVTTGTEWPGGGSGTTITYSYDNLLDGNLPGGLTAAQLKSAVEEALTLWATYAPLNFVEQPDSGPAAGTSYSASGHPQIRFGHTLIDGTPPTTDILAQAGIPGTTGASGDVVFDNGNTWALHPSQGIDFLDVAVHEIGHALGLDHPPPASQGGVDAVMNEEYVGLYNGPGTAFLFPDDINGIRFVYGVGTGSVTPLVGGGDDHGNTPSTATPVSIDTTVIGNREVAGDLDAFSFSAVAGTTYTFETHLGTLADTTMELIAQDGTTVLGFDDDSGEGKASRIIWTATGTGTYYLSIDAFLFSQTGTYTLTVTHHDDHGGAAASATPLAINVGQSGTIGTAGDQDWFSFTVTAGQTYRVLMDADSLSFGHLTLYAADGFTPLLSGNGQGAGSDPWLVFEADATGLVYIAAKGNTTETGSYVVSFTTLDGFVTTTPGSGMVSEVKVLNASNGSYLYSFNAYGTFTGGAHVTMADVNGDGIADVITGANAGGTPLVRVVSGANGADLMTFLAYDSAFSGGVRVAAGDITGDNKAEIFTAPGAGGGPHIRAFAAMSGTEVFSYFAYDQALLSGVYLAAADVNDDGKADIITGPGAGGGPHVRVVSGANGTTELHSFFAYDQAFNGGIFVAGADVNGDDKAEIITGPGAGGGPHVRVFNGVTATEITSIFPYAGFTGGVRVGAADLNADGHAEIITAPGAGGGPHVRVFNGLNYSDYSQFFAYATTFTGGVFLGGSPRVLPGSGPSPLVRNSGAATESLSVFVAPSIENVQEPRVSTPVLGRITTVEDRIVSEDDEEQTVATQADFEEVPSREFSELELEIAATIFSEENLGGLLD